MVRPISVLTGLVWRTQNFADVTWLGHPIWQNPLDAWGVQEAIVADGVDLVVECGTNRGGSALYMASIFDLLGRGQSITVEVEAAYEPHPSESRVPDWFVDRPCNRDKGRGRVAELDVQQVMLLLDSDHTGPHVFRELHAVADLVRVGGYLLVQDGCVDELRVMRALVPDLFGRSNNSSRPTHGLRLTKVAQVGSY